MFASPPSAYRNRNLSMIMQDNKSSGRRRGPRRRRHNEDGSHRDGSNGNSYQPQRQSDYKPSSRRSTPEAKPGFFQKILSFFGLGPKAKSYPPYGAGNRASGSSAAASNGTSHVSTHPAQRAAQSPRPARKPEAIEVTSPKLYVGNLSFDAGESDLSELFNGVGAVRSVEIVTYKDTEKSKGFGFITMSAIEEAKRAVAELHDKEFMGRKLVVSGAKTNDRA